MASLGAAVLELRTDLRPMAAGLKAGERELGASLKRQEVMVAEHTSRVGQMMSASAASSRSLALGHGDNTAALSRSTEAMRAETVAAGGLAGAQRGVAREAAGEAESHARLAPRVAKTTAEHRALKDGVEQAGYAFSGFSGRAGAAGRSLDLAARHAQIFKSAGIDYISAGLVAGGVALIGYGTKANIAFDTVGKSIQRQAGTSRQVTNQLLNDVKSVGAQAPESWKSIGDAVAAQYRLFGSSNAEIKRNTDLFLAFAESAHTDVVPAITDISNIMRLFHPAGMSAVDVMDQLVNLAQRTQRPLSDFLGVITKYGPQFNAMGLSFTQTIGLMQAFSKAGVTTTQMGRGLNTAITQAAKATKDHGQASGDAGAKLLTYQTAVQSAQQHVDTLSEKLRSGKGDQSKLNEEMGIAQNRLTIAKDKLDQYTKSTAAASGAHRTIAQQIAFEAAQVEGARTKTEALNLAIQYFGARLGPQMAAALFHNKAGLDAMDRSLGDAHGKTEDLAKAQRDTLHGQLEILHHDFDVLASKVGLSANGLKSMVGSIADVVKAISSLPKPVLDFLVYGAAGGGAAMLLARHTPIGGLASRALGLEAGGPLSTALVGKSGTGAAIARGGTVADERVGASQVTEMTVGTLIAKSMVGGGGGLPGKGGKGGSLAGDAKAAEGDAARAGETEAAAAEGGMLSRFKGFAPKLGGLLKGGLKAGMVGAAVTIGTQLLGDVVGGKAGGVIHKAGSVAGLTVAGGMIGEIGGPPGMAIGAAIGAAVGLGIALIHKRNYGRDVADAVFKNFGGRSAAPALARHMEDELNKANSILRRSGRTTMVGMQVQTVLDPTKAHELNEHARKAGHDAMQQMEAGWSQFKVQDPDVMWRQFTDMTKKFPRGRVGAQMKSEAAQEMLAYTQELIRQGKLPQGAYKQMLDRINAQFPWWRKELAKAAVDSAATFARNLNLKGAENSVHNSLNRIRNDIPGIAQVMDRTKGDFVTKAAAVTNSLQDIARKGGPAGRAAKAAITDLKNSTSRDLTTMAHQTQQNVQSMKDALSHGSNDARNAAVTNVKNMQQDINRAYQAGLIDTQSYTQRTKDNFSVGWNAVRTQTAASFNAQERDLRTSLANREIDQGTFNSKLAALDAQKNQAQSTSLQAYTNNMLKAMQQTGSVNWDGMAAIIKQYNDTASQFGAPPLKPPGKLINALGSSASVKLGQTITAAQDPNKTAGGGVFQLGRPGEAGRDNIPLNVGGRDILAAGGEQVVVFNRHQIPDVNRRFSDTGGLPGYFAQNRRPNYAPMAEGGIVKAAAGYQGYALPLPRQYMTNMSDDAGVDMPAPGGTPEYAIGPGRIISEGQPSGFGPWVPAMEISEGPAAGRQIYYGHAGPNVKHTGDTVKAGEQITQVGQGIVGISTGPHIEIGFLPFNPGGGGAMHAFLNQLLSGAGVTQVGGGVAGANVVVPMIKAPKASGDGALTAMVNKNFVKTTDLANKKLQSMASALGSPGSGAFSGTLSGPVEKQVYDFFSANGFNKIAIAGMLGNAEAESSMNPSEPGGGLWQQISNFGSGAPPLLQQMQAMLPQIQGIKGAMNAASSPGEAARIFMEGFERPGIPRLDVRESAANAAFAAGYSLGGIPVFNAAGIAVPGTGYVQAMGGKPLNQSQKNFIKHFEKQPKNKGHRIPAAALKRHKLKVGKKPPVNQDLVGTFPNAGLRGYGGTNPFNIGKDMRAINSALDLIFGLVGGGEGGNLGGGDADKMSKLIAEKTALYSSGLYPAPNFGDWASPANFVISTDPTTGQPVTPNISPNIDVVGHQLEEILSYQNQWVADLQGGLNATNALKPSVHNAIVYREKQIAAIKRKVQANIKRINQLKDDLKRRQARMKQLQGLIKDRHAKIKAERAKRNPDHAKLAQWGQEVTSFSQELHVLSQGDKPTKDEIAKLENENMGFVGGKDAIPSTPGGESGQIQAQLGAPAGGTAVEHLIGGGSSASGLYQVEGAVKAWSDQIGGPDGDLFQQSLQARLYAKGLADLAPGASTALGIARAGATSSHDQELISQLQQKLQQTSQELAVNTAQERVLLGAGDLAFGVRELPPWGGSFMREGVIPGPLGAPRLIEGHGGEEISWPGGDDDSFEIHHHYAPGMEFLKDLITTEVRKGGQTIRPRAALPSAGGGVLT